MDPHAKGVCRVEEQRRLGADIGRAPDARNQGFADLIHRSLEDAAEDAFLSPSLTFLKQAIGEEACELRAGAGAARRTIVGLAGTEHKVTAIGGGGPRWTEHPDVVDF